jgi:hypothetical protein
MRVVLLIGIALLGVAAKLAAGPVHKCTHVSRGYRACTTFYERKGEQSAIYHRAGGGWKKVAGGLGRPGWWRRVVAAPNRVTLLAQWSGECEAQSTHFVSASSGRTRPIFRGRDSTIAGWTDSGLALVRLNEAIWRGQVKLRGPGVYLVDPRTGAATLRRLKPARPGC